MIPRAREIAETIGKCKKIKDYQKRSIYIQKVGLFRANTHCFSIIIDCFRDYLGLLLTGKTIFNSVKVLFSSFDSV